MSATYTPANEPFLKHLAVQKTPYLFLSAETDDFDEDIIEAWANEGFHVTYVPLGQGGPEYTTRLHSVADNAVGMSDHYAIVGKWTNSDFLPRACVELTRSFLNV